MFITFSLKKSRRMSLISIEVEITIRIYYILHFRAVIYEKKKQYISRKTLTNFYFIPI